MVPAESSHFNDFPPHTDVNYLEAPPNNSRTAEQALHFFWLGVGGHVKILGMVTQQQIAHAAAHQECRIACIFQLFDNPDSCLADIFT